MNDERTELVEINIGHSLFIHKNTLNNEKINIEKDEFSINVVRNFLNVIENHRLFFINFLIHNQIIYSAITFLCVMKIKDENITDEEFIISSFENTKEELVKKLNEFLLFHGLKNISNIDPKISDLNYSNNISEFDDFMIKNIERETSPFKEN